MKENADGNFEEVEFDPIRILVIESRGGADGNSW